MADTPKTSPVITPSPALLDLLQHIQNDRTTKLILVQEKDAEGGWIRVGQEDWDVRAPMHTLEDKSYEALQEVLELGQEILDRSDNRDALTPTDLAKLKDRVKALPTLTLVPGPTEVVDVDGDIWDVEPTAKTKAVELLELEFVDERYRNNVGDPIKVEIDGPDITIAIGCQRRSLALWEREGARIVAEYFGTDRDLPREPHFNRYPNLPRRNECPTADAHQQACLEALKAEEKRYATAMAEYEKALKAAGPTTRDRMVFALEQVCAALRARFGTPKPTRKRAAKTAAKKAARKSVKKIAKKATKQAARRR